MKTEGKLTVMALFVVAVAMTLPQPAAADWKFTWANINYYERHPEELIEAYKAFMTRQMRPFVEKLVWLVEKIFGMVGRPLKSLEEVMKWKRIVLAALKERLINRNPFVRCCRKGWPKCWKSLHGTNWFSNMFCPVALYWECDIAYVKIVRSPPPPGPPKPSNSQP